MMLFLPKLQKEKPQQDAQTEQNARQGGVSEESLRERRYLWTARAFFMVFVVSVIVNIFMLSALFSLVPLTRVQPYELVFSDKNAQTVEVLPFQPRADLIKGISESMIRQYVVSRHTMTADPDEMAYRWGPNGLVALLSTDSTFSQFVGEAQKILEVAISKQVTRNVIITSVMPYAYGESGEYWVVSFTLETMSPQRASKERTAYVATVYVTYEPFRGTWENRLKNPIGFRVMQYGSETKESYDKREREKLR